MADNLISTLRRVRLRREVGETGKGPRDALGPHSLPLIG